MPSSHQVIACIAYTSYIVIAMAAPQSDLPNTTYSGYLFINKSDGSELFYAYYEAQGQMESEAPLLLWLQV